MRTIEDVLKKLMDEHDIEGDAEDFLSTAADFLYEYSELLKETEPQATRTIERCQDMAGQLNRMCSYIDDTI